MYYLQSRYYDPEVGRFVNGDDAVMMIFGVDNLFDYCENNTINCIDIYGFAPILFTLTAMHNAVVMSAGSYLFAKGFFPQYEVWTCSKGLIYNGRMDIYSYAYNCVWEVKRNNYRGINDGKKQLERYTSSYVYLLAFRLVPKYVKPKYGVKRVSGVTISSNYFVYYWSLPSLPALIVYDYKTLKEAAQILFKPVLMSAKEVEKFLKNQLAEIRTKAKTAIAWLKEKARSVGNKTNDFVRAVSAAFASMASSLFTCIIVLFLLLVVGFAVLA